MPHYGGMTHDAEPLFDQAYWDARYAGHEGVEGAEAGHVWSSEPNPQLVAEATALAPGRALDVGAGEGADSLWLARHGWAVTAIDISTVALQKAARFAEHQDPDASSRIVYEQHDVTAWAPEEASFDLISSQFMHLPRPERTRLFAGLAAGVRAGGTLLVVGHDVADLDSGAHRLHRDDLMFTADEVVSALDPERWVVEVAESRPRDARGDDAETVEVHDVVVRARRL